MTARTTTRPFILGLTGSIGMGKSTTAKLFAEAGVPVYDADAAVHALYEAEAVAPLEAAFAGVGTDGRIDRQKLAARVLGDAEAMARLEAIVHPLVRARQQAFLAAVARAGAPVVVLDIPLLFETGGDKTVDAVVVVSAPPDMQRARILEREAMTADKLDAILARQLPDAEKRARADFVVDTSNGLEPVRARIAEILARVATMPRRTR
ncbi:MAG: dephospho-CoA kinase [Xanthobacteraceae bacterium]|nr:MAG: dephospho-CoA kinase [Xanthobacteraceae bacterium]